MADSKLTIEIAANVSQAVKGIESVSKSMEDASKKANSFGGKLSSVGLSLSAFNSILGTVTTATKRIAQTTSELVSIYAIQEQAQTRLATTLKATNNAVGMSATELYNLASAFQEVSTYGDEAIIGVEALFVSTGKISKDVMPSAIEATLDMASALGEDLTSAARRLAKVLADPKSNLDALKDANIQLSEAQKEEIKRLQESNNLYDAQAIVLDSVASSYGGIAKSLADTDTGKLTQIQNVWGDIKEGLGQGLLNTISPALDILYEQLLKISGWVNDKVLKQDVIGTYREGGSFDFSQVEEANLLSLLEELTGMSRTGMGSQSTVASNALADLRAELDSRNVFYEGRRFISDQEIAEMDRAAEILRTNKYGNRKKEYEASGGVADYEWQHKGINAGEFSITDIANYNKAIEIYNGAASREKLNKELAMEMAAEASILAKASNAKTANNEGQTDVKAVTSNKLSASSFISSNKSLSTTAQISALYSKIATATNLIGEAKGSEKEALIEIRESLYEELTALERVHNGIEDINDESLKAVDVMANVSSQLQEYGSSALSLFSSIGSLVDAVYSNQINAIDSLLSETEEKWDKTLDRLSDKQDIQKDSLMHLYDEGLISLDEYDAAIKQMNEDKIAAEKKAQSEEEKLQAEKNKLLEKQFNANKANQITEALMNGAMAITSIWASHAANPVMAGILTGMASANVAAQVATISSSEFTPMATGGIVTKPTYALLGEGGYKEAVLPLTETNMKRAGLANNQNGVIELTINIGTSFNGDQLSEDVFRGIERAQRTGLLPRWRYA